MRIICIEGLDAVGKETISKYLTEKLEVFGYNVKRVSFPRYDTSYGMAIRDVLNGRCGDASKMDPDLISSLYVLDRIDYFKEHFEEFKYIDFLILDRGFYSNFMYQCSKLAKGVNVYGSQIRYEIFEWITKNAKYEFIDTGLFGKNAIAESIDTIFLTMNDDSKRKEHLKNRDYIDTNEANDSYLNNCKKFVENTINNRLLKQHFEIVADSLYGDEKAFNVFTYNAYIKNVHKVEVAHGKNEEEILSISNNVVDTIINILAEKHPNSIVKMSAIVGLTNYDILNITSDFKTYARLQRYFTETYTKINNFITEHSNIKGIGDNKLLYIGLSIDKEAKVFDYHSTVIKFAHKSFDLLLAATNIERAVYDEYIKYDANRNNICLDAINDFPIYYNGSCMYLENNSKGDTIDERR